MITDLKVYKSFLISVTLTTLSNPLGFGNYECLGFFGVVHGKMNVSKGFWQKIWEKNSSHREVHPFILKVTFLPAAMTDDLHLENFKKTG